MKLREFLISRRSDFFYLTFIYEALWHWSCNFCYWYIINEPFGYCFRVVYKNFIDEIFSPIIRGGGDVFVCDGGSETTMRGIGESDDVVIYWEGGDRRRWRWGGGGRRWEERGKDVWDSSNRAKSVNEGKQIAFLLNKYYFLNFKSQPLIAFFSHFLHPSLKWTKWSKW